MRDGLHLRKGGAKSLSFGVRSREAEVATKKFNVFAEFGDRFYRVNATALFSQRCFCEAVCSITVAT